jgi:plastocyanin
MSRLLSFTLLALVASASFAATDELTLTIRNHAFEPKEVRIAAGAKVKLKVINEDATPAEFESKTLHREKVIPGKASAIINLGPLKPGRYPFVEEYHEKDAAAQGVIVVE